MLRKPIDMEKRELVQRREATLLDLRSYLFSRQCTLLLFLQRPWEVAQRALELLHSCVQELRLLEVSGSLSWQCPPYLADWAGGGLPLLSVPGL